MYSASRGSTLRGGGVRAGSVFAAARRVRRQRRRRHFGSFARAQVLRLSPGARTSSGQHPMVGTQSATRSLQTISSARKPAFGEPHSAKPPEPPRHYGEAALMQLNGVVRRIRRDIPIVGIGASVSCVTGRGDQCINRSGAYGGDRGNQSIRAVGSYPAKQPDAPSFGAS